MKRGILWLTLVIFLCAAVLPVCAAGSGFSRGGYDPYDYFGDEEGPFGFGRRDESVAETTLKCEPNARTVKSGDELGVDLHLLLSEADQELVETIEQGATVEYTLVTAPVENEEQTAESAPESASFSMDRKNNERCTLLLRPQVTENSVMTVKVKMTLANGRSFEAVSEKVLVYTEPLIRSHGSAQECEPGEGMDMDFMLIGPEGIWQFTAWLAMSDDGTTFVRREGSAEFQVNTHEREPKARVHVTVPDKENAFFRLELEVVLQDGTTLTHVTEPVRIGGASVSI